MSTGYPKIWTSIRHEWWWKKLKAAGRGALLEMILMVKDQLDNGHLVVHSLSGLAGELSINRKVLARLVTFLAVVGTIRVVENDQRIYHLFFPNYMKWQKMTAREAVENAHLGSQEQPPPDQTRPDQTRPEEEPPVSNKEIKAEIAESLATSPVAMMHQKFRDNFESWRGRDVMWYDRQCVNEILAVKLKGISLSLKEFMLSVMGDFSHDVYNRPDKFLSKNMTDQDWRDRFMGYVHLLLKEDRMGDYGMKVTMSAADEIAHEESKRRQG